MLFRKIDNFFDLPDKNEMFETEKFSGEIIIFTRILISFQLIVSILSRFTFRDGIRAPLSLMPKTYRGY